MVITFNYLQTNELREIEASMYTQVTNRGLFGKLEGLNLPRAEPPQSVVVQVFVLFASLRHSIGSVWHDECYLHQQVSASTLMHEGVSHED